MIRMILEFTRDQNSQEILQDKSGNHQVMMEWEKPYMIECITKLNPSGDVLEIGFGLGYSATAILEYSAVTSYTVIECCPVVWDKVEELKLKYPEITITLVKGRWEDVLITLGKYDSIFFDDYVSQKHTRFTDFLEITLEHNSVVGSRISCYCTCNPSFDIHCITTELYDYEVSIPSICKYARGNKMYIPVLTKICEPLSTDFGAAATLAVTRPETSRNIVVIDNFLSNPDSVRDFALKETFSHDISVQTYANDALKKGIETQIGSPITKWNNCHNGRYELTTCLSNRIIKYHDNTMWSGALFLTPGASPGSGLGVYQCKGGVIKNYDDIKNYKHDKYYSAHKQDPSKWTQTDMIGNVYNRLVLFKSNLFISNLEYFGITPETGRLIQVFYFS
jgi:hypothetical protein